MAIPTSDYPYCRFDFPEWNPVQEKCLEFFTKDKNLVISASMASGKTAIAEAIMGYELSFPNSKVVYVSPLKALSHEKYELWTNHETFGKYRIVIMDSDHEVTALQIRESRLIIATVESMNIRCRNREEWLKQVRVMVFDEAHLFDHEKRGAASESLMMDLSDLNPACRLVCLSGTLSNTKELALWCHSLNGKPTSYLASDWRPTKLEKTVKFIEKLEDQFKYVLQMVQNFPEQKILIFVHSKKIGSMLRDLLRSQHVRCGFYSADLEQEKRDELVKKFRDETSMFQVLIATSSLSQGVSL